MIENKENVYDFADEFWKSLRDKHISEKNKCSTCKYIVYFIITNFKMI